MPCFGKKMKGRRGKNLVPSSPAFCFFYVAGPPSPLLIHLQIFSAQMLLTHTRFPQKKKGEPFRKSAFLRRQSSSSSSSSCLPLFSLPLSLLWEIMPSGRRGGKKRVHTKGIDKISRRERKTPFLGAFSSDIFIPFSFFTMISVRGWVVVVGGLIWLSREKGEGGKEKWEDWQQTEELCKKWNKRKRVLISKGIENKLIYPDVSFEAWMDYCSFMYSAWALIKIAKFCKLLKYRLCVFVCFIWFPKGEPLPLTFPPLWKVVWDREEEKLLLPTIKWGNRRQTVWEVEELMKKRKRELIRQISQFSLAKNGLCVKNEIYGRVCPDHPF